MVVLGARRWPEIDRPLVLLPLGSCEQHGPHLPLATDTVVAASVAELAAAELAAVVAPAMAYGASGEHEDFAGTISIGHEALAAVLIALVRSARRWCGRLVVVNGHGGNLDGLVAAVRALRVEGHDVAWWSPRVAGADAHAGRTETSLMLALRTVEVRLDRAEAGAVEPLDELMPTLRARGVRAVSPNGVLGDPAGATAAEGRDLCAAMARDLCAAVCAWRVGDGGEL